MIFPMGVLKKSSRKEKWKPQISKPLGNTLTCSENKVHVNKLQHRKSRSRNSETKILTKHEVITKQSQTKFKICKGK